MRDQTPVIIERKMSSSISGVRFCSDKCLSLMIPGRQCWKQSSCMELAVVANTSSM